MKQEEFFKLLDRRLSIIEDNERQDILDEYRQHIAMKIQDDHISEEEALADFGDVDSFADEILSAYHVRTGSAVTAAKPIRGIVARMQSTAANAWHHIAGFFAGIGKKIAGFFSGIWGKLRGTMHREKQETDHEKKVKSQGSLWKQFLGWLVSAGKNLWRWLCNLLYGGIGISFAVLGAFLLVVFGGFIVIALQGYPLVGATVFLLGLLLCTGVSAVFFCSLFRCRPKNTSGKEKLENGKE